MKKYGSTPSSHSFFSSSLGGRGRLQRMLSPIGMRMPAKQHSPRALRRVTTRSTNPVSTR